MIDYLSKPFVCRAEMHIYFSSLCPDARVKRSFCTSCTSLGCPSSPCYVPVSKWRCYQKKYENRVPRFDTIIY